MTPTFLTLWASPGGDVMELGVPTVGEGLDPPWGRCKMLQRPFYRKMSPSVTDVGAVCDRPRATAGRPYGFFCEFFVILQQAPPLKAITA